MPRVQHLAERAFDALESFLHIEAVGGIVLLLAAALALLWANSPMAGSYGRLWHVRLSIGVGAHVFSPSLHFWINDGLMTVFFLVVGMEIRREIHQGALRDFRQAALPLLAALGGVAAPALIYLALNAAPARHHGWAIPTATDIAFAVGVLALLGRAVPGNLRVFLLALAIIDDIVAVLIIAVFYAGGLDCGGFLVAGIGVLLVLGMQRIGIGSAWPYVLPGAVVWAGMLTAGVHPALAGVVLGLLTPVRPLPMRERPLDVIARAPDELDGGEPHALARPLRRLRVAQREVLAPVSRVQMALHPWVTCGVMPLFALANAGVALGGVHLSGSARFVMLGVMLALVLGKPLGIVAVSWIVVRLGWCRLPPGMSWGGLCLVGLLAGIGFTMAIFIAMLAFADANLIEAAKLGVLLASLVAGMLGLGWGSVYVRRLRARGDDAGGRTEPGAAD